MSVALPEEFMYRLVDGCRDSFPMDVLFSEGIESALTEVVFDDFPLGTLSSMSCRK